MADFVIEAPAVTAVPVAGGGAFPVRRVYCVGRNYAEHVREMGHREKEPPFFFMKPRDALVTGGADTPYPPQTADLHHEIELVVALGRGGSAVTEAEALQLVWGYGAGIDLTRRDLQALAREAGKPWTMAKSFDHSGPIGALAPAAQTGHPTRGAISLSVNGQPRQAGDIADMIWGVPQIIAALSRFVTLAPGDLIFTGTPAGVGAVVAGDRLEGNIAGVGTVTTTLV